MVEASTTSLSFFLLILSALVLVSAKFLRLGAIFYLGGFAVLVQVHWVEQSPVPRLPLLMFAVLAISFGFALSSKGKRIAI
jgi:hypothetical protein